MEFFKEIISEVLDVPWSPFRIGYEGLIVRMCLLYQEDRIILQNQALWILSFEFMLRISMHVYEICDSLAMYILLEC